MGHVVDYRIFKPQKGGTAPVDRMRAWAEDFARVNVDRLENPSGSYHGNFRQLTAHTFRSREDAEEYLRDQIGDYRDGYVAFYGAPDSQAYRDAVWAAKQIRVKKAAYDASYLPRFRSRKYQTITCRSCGKALDAYSLPTVYCPHCGADLRDKASRERAEGYARKIEKADRKVKELEKGDKLMYMAKVEVHC